MNVTNGDSTVGFAVTNRSQIEDEHHGGPHLVLYVGCALSVCSLLAATTLYATNKHIRVKRPHIITINLCMSLLVFYVGYWVSLFVRNESPVHVHESTANSSISGGCLAGAVLVVVGWCCADSWLVVHWLFFTFTIHKRASPHISNFFVKSAVPVYGFSLLIVTTLCIVNKSNDNNFINEFHCWFTLRHGTIKIVAYLFLSLVVTAITCSAVFCLLRVTVLQVPNTVTTKIKKSRRMFARLMALTLLMAIVHTPHMVLWIKDFDDYSVSVRHAWEIGSGVVNALQGFLVAFCLLFRSEEMSICKSAMRNAKKRNRNSIKGGAGYDAAAPLYGKSASGAGADCSELQCDDAGDDQPRRSPRIEPRERRASLTEKDEMFLKMSASPSRSRKSLHGSGPPLPGDDQRQDQLISPNNLQGSTNHLSTFGRTKKGNNGAPWRRYSSASDKHVAGSPTVRKLLQSTMIDPLRTKSCSDHPITTSSECIHASPTDVESMEDRQKGDTESGSTVPA